MPIMNVTKGTTLSLRIYAARTFVSRLVGLLGTARADRGAALLIVPGSGIHTFGMRYPIDVLFLDKVGRVVRKFGPVMPNRVLKPVPSAVSILEVPTGALPIRNVEEGDRLRIAPDEAHRPDFRALGNVFHWPFNAFIALLWGRFVHAAMEQWVAQWHPLNLGILIHNTLLMYFFLTRRKSIEISLRFRDWAIPFLTLCGAMLIRPAPQGGYPPALLSSLLQCIGIAGIIFSLLSLGKSFGIVPANRKIVSSGAYRIVRHPLYASEMVFYAGFLSGNPSLYNSILIAAILAGQLWRSLSEERLLARDPSYRFYQQQVRYRFIPGLV